MAAPLGKKPTACVPCHERKVRCDSTAVGFPCSRCITKDRTDLCIMLERGGRNSHKRRRTTAEDNSLRSPRQRDEDVSVEQQTPTSSNRTHEPNPDYSAGRILTPATSVNPQRHASFSHTDVANGLLELSHAGSNGLGTERLQHATHRSDPGPPTQYLVSDEDAHLQTLYHMADEDQVVPSPVPLTISEQGQQVIEYYGELNSVTVLSEVLGQCPRRLIRLDLPGPAAVGALQREFSRLDDADVAYLSAKHVHDFPPPGTCRAFLQLFFKRVYPYTPILNRQQVLEDYERGSCSSFLLWSIFANVAPYASPELLLESGYTEYSVAQKNFFSKARLLYDFGCEKGQLNLIQGSILLSSFQFSFAPDKDFRFWFHNATRIALQMGFNKRDIGNNLDLPTYHLVRRIWWVLYSRDVWFSLVGFENTRRIPEEETEILLLKPEDWSPELAVAPHYKDIIPDISPLQQHFFTEICRLNLLGAHFLSLLRPNRAAPTLPEAHSFTNSLTTWRTSFPEDLLPDRVDHWDDTNAWILFLWSMGFRLECSFYRTLRQRARGIDDESASWANKRLRRCIFELDTVLKRAIVNDVARFCPPSLIICTSHLLALQLEVVLDPTVPDPQRIAAKTQIHTSLAYLRGISERWLNAKWTFRVFDTVTKRLGMPMEGHDLPNAGLTAGYNTDPELWRQASLQNDSVAQGSMNFGQPQAQQDELALPDRWIESLLTENLMNGLDDGMFNLFMP